MKTSSNTPLAPFTSLRVGGPAEVLVECSSIEEVTQVLQDPETKLPVTMLGFGSNSLISDRGLPGTVIIWRGGNMSEGGGIVVVDAGVWWDDLVKFTMDRGLWGLELMSEIPSSVGGAVFGNIAAYGQQVSDTLLYIEVYDHVSDEIRRINASDIQSSYRASSLQNQPELVILRAAFQLSSSKLHELQYASAVAVASKLGVDTETLEGRRTAIIETRRHAGSLYHFDDPNAQRTAGSFFKNPMVSTEQAKHLAQFDETGKSLERINEQNRIHGGDTHRASAAHVLLAAGFNRGQTWEHVRLHEDHVLKIETLPGATAQEVYRVAKEIVDTVQRKLDITITPEVRFFGDFS